MSYSFFGNYVKIFDYYQPLFKSCQIAKLRFLDDGAYWSQAWLQLWPLLDSSGISHLLPQGGIAVPLCRALSLGWPSLRSISFLPSFTQLRSVCGGGEAGQLALCVLSHPPVPRTVLVGAYAAFHGVKSESLQFSPPLDFPVLFSCFLSRVFLHHWASKVAMMPPLSIEDL